MTVTRTGQRALFAAFMVAAILAPGVSPAAGTALTGDPALACDAILCMSSGTRPNECASSVARYFSINRKDWGDTVNARRDFLHLCPSSTAPVLQTRIEEIVNGAGLCYAAYLNATNTKVMIKHVCPTSTTYSTSNSLWGTLGQPYNNDSNCVDQEVTVVNNQAPAYCVSYANKQLTWLLGVTYQGDPLNGGHWVDDASAAGQPIR